MATIGEKQYTLQALPIKQAREFRKKLENQLQELASAVGQFGPGIKGEGGSIDAVQGLITSVSNVLLAAPDLMLNLLCEYSPEVREDREWIEEHGFDAEIMKGFQEMLGQLYPFGSLTSLFRGLPGTTTSKNSHLPRTG